MNIPELEAKALWVRRKVLEMAVAADSGHVSTAMSQTEILVALYYGGILRHDPTNPKWEDRDVFLLSKGQGGIGLYPVLADRGYFPVKDLDNFCGPGSHIGVHAEWHCPGIEMISGSLGHGLPVATGIAQAMKTDGKDTLVFCLVGDGELHEGSNWEALMSAAQLKLGNLIIIVDRNGQNTIGRTREPFELPKDGPNLDPLRDKFEAFGCNTHFVKNGHDIHDVVSELSWPRPSSKYYTERPHVVIINTVKGKGLSIMEDKRDWHYRCPRGAELKQCQSDLQLPHYEPPATPQAKHGVAMRDRYFDALYEHFKADKNCVLITADNGWPGIDKFAALPGQFYQVGIAEQQMVGMAAGLAMRGRKVWCYAINPFVTTRVHEFVKLDCCAMNLPVHMLGVGAGWAYDIMGPTHSSDIDIAIMRALPNLTTWTPADSYCAAAVADATAKLNGPSHVRLDRGGIPDLYAGRQIDWSKGLVRTDYCDDKYDVERPILKIIATGIMVHQALKVAAYFPEFEVQVIDLFKLNPPPGRELFEALTGADYVVTLEEHQLNGGLSGIFAEFQADWFCGCARKHLRLAAPNKISFALGGREEIWKDHKLDLDSVVRRIRGWVEKGYDV